MPFHGSSRFTLTMPIHRNAGRRIEMGGCNVTGRGGARPAGQRSGPRRAAGCPSVGIRPPYATAYGVVQTEAVRSEYFTEAREQSIGFRFGISYLRSFTGDRQELAAKPVTGFYPDENRLPYDFSLIPPHIIAKLCPVRGVTIARPRSHITRPRPGRCALPSNTFCATWSGRRRGQTDAPDRYANTLSF